MKILWLSHLVPFPPAGGAPQRAYHLLTRTAKHHEVHLVALHQPRLLPGARAVDEAKAALSRFCASVTVCPMAAERSSVHRAGSALRSLVTAEPHDLTWMRSVEMPRALDPWRRDRGLDLVHVDTIGLWPHVRGWPDMPPVLLGHHNIESHLASRRAAGEGRFWASAFLRQDARKLRAVERDAAQHVAANVVVCSLDAARLRAIAPSARIVVVENGVDTEYFRPSGAGGEGFVFAGTLGWYPNRDAVSFLLDEIWPLLVSRLGSRRLVVVGRDPSPAALAAARADPQVVVTGFVPDVRPYLDGASIYLCPIRIGGGTRLKVLDALSMAKPLVSTAAGVEGLDLTAGEHYLPAETAGEFVDQVERLERDPALARALGERGRRQARDRHDWRIPARQLEMAYQAACIGSTALEGTT